MSGGTDRGGDASATSHRISAGALVVRDGRILLVRHLKPGAYDFWVAPGGGVRHRETLQDAVVREVREETGLEVEPRRLAYIEELVSPRQRLCKFWFAARPLGGRLSAEHEAAKREHIVEACWKTRAALGDLCLYPPVLKDAFWSDWEAGFPEPRHLGLREMQI